MSTIALDIPAFRALFPQFASSSDALITAQWGLATAFVSDSTYGCMSLAARTSALQLMTAHLLTLSALAAGGGSSGGAGGVVTSSSVGDVSVSMAAPPFGTSQWRWWMNLTPYGAQLAALLDAQAAGGMYIGGLPERSAFRKWAGVF